MKIIISFIAIILMISQLNAQDDNTRELKTQAVKALESFSKIVSKTNYKTLGFENAGEISKGETIYLTVADQYGKQSGGHDGYLCARIPDQPFRCARCVHRRL